MKKGLAVLMAGTLMISLAGCASSEKKEKQTEVTTEMEATTVVETTIEETTTEVETTTVEETTTEAPTKAAHPSKESKCKSPQAAIKPVCKGFMNGDIDEMMSTFPSDLLEYKSMKAVRGELKDVLSQLKEMKAEGMSYKVSVGDVGEPSSTTVDGLNQEFEDLGVDFRVSEIKSVAMAATVSVGEESVTQDVMTCVAGKIGKYWYFITVE